MRRLTGWLLAVVVLVGAAGCVRIPTDGPVRSIPQRTRTAEPQIDIEQQAPPPGASPEVVVYGFLQAMAQSAGDYTVARSFLTSQAALDWQPGRQTLIYADTGAPRFEGERASIQTTIVGRLDERGSFQRVGQQRYQHDFGLVREGGEWRISAPPDGRLLSGYLFHSAFVPLTVYFYDSQLRSLVPDSFYVPRGRRTATTAVQTLLAGPSTWLAPAVASAIPPETRLTAGEVEVQNDGTAIVPLSREVGQLDAEGRTRLARQLAVTLAANQLPVDATQLLVRQESVPLDLPGHGNDGAVPISQFDGDRPTALSASSDLYGIASNRLVRVVQSSNDTIKTQALAGGLGGWQSGLGALAVNPTATRIAYVRDRNRIYVGDLSAQDAPRVPVFSGAGVISPGFSRFDELWFLSGPPGAQQVHRWHSDKLETVPAPALQGIAVTSIKLGPSGVRALVVGRRGDADVVGMVLVERGDTLRLDSWRELRIDDGGPAPVSVASAGWLDDHTLLMLGRSGESSTLMPFQTDVDAVTVTPGQPPRDWKATTVVATPYAGIGQAVVLGSDGQVWRRSDDRRWTTYANGLSAVAFPG